MTMHRENLANEMALKAAAVRLVSSKTGAEPGVVEDWIKEISEPDQNQRIIDRFEEEDRRTHPYIPTSVKRRELMDNHENWAGVDFYEWTKDVAPDYFERRAAKRKTKEQG